ncbi:uncharacterized protein LOC114752781 [Neltuma alba]|uniref:uncharacterized protein LOC114741429 n=1 Tax=Neltuma alba TaxID=207710 RepID=UPI0010A58747|nr:uncharacterized protein LOC114741429 [Prosopis alba]XP_028797320.1 uncharacterized protein LOC114752781 [Prosopis alba]
MGNYVSCTLSTPGSKNLRAIKVIFPGGEIKELRAPIRAAELMLEKPNFFVVNARALQIGRRFSALSADEELEFSNVYVMFPMKRLNSKVTGADMGSLLLTANAAVKKVSGGKARVLPESYSNNNDSVEEKESNDMAAPSPAVKLELDDIEEFSRPEFMHRLSMCRSKKPLLETITEEPVCSR